MKIKYIKKVFLTGIVILLCIFFFSSVNCKSPSSPDTVIVAKITFNNDCGVSLDIYMDGIFQFSLDYLYSHFIESVSEGTHFLEAKKSGTLELVQEATFDVEAGIEYVWTILSPASVLVTNEYGESINIYADNYLQISVEDQKSSSIYNITYGEHLLQAIRTADTTGTVIASIIIDIVENKEYLWTVTN